ncbi:hypothetical protein D9X30_3833 [Cupriavidus sp. U2]|nr:hypothetical protein D9X30_3833 [Cupriavidus sp. U2]
MRPFSLPFFLAFFLPFFFRGTAITADFRLHCRGRLLSPITLDGQDNKGSDN